MNSSIRSTSKNLVLFACVTASTALLALACAMTPPMPRLTAQPGVNQQILYEDGAEKIVSMGNGSIVSIRMAEPMGGHSTFVVGVANQSNAQVVIGPEMVTIEQSGRSLRVLPYEEVERIEREKAESARRNQSMLSILSTVQSMTGVPTGPYSSIQSSLQTAQKTMMTAVSSGMSKAASAAELNLKELSSVALKKNTLFPATQGGGVVYAEGRTPGPISVRVQVGSDAHDFQFAL